MAAVLALCAIGLVLSWELILLHFRVHTDPNYHSFCAVSASFNCETVAESPYAVFLGVPLAVWGLIGYLVILGTALFGVILKNSNGARLGLCILTGFAAVTGIVLALVSYCIICSFCLFCSITYLVNLVLFILSAIELRRSGVSLGDAGRELAGGLMRQKYQAVILVLCLGLLALFFPRYWQSSARKGVTIGTEGVIDGLHWTGAAEPRLRITEFSDYLCPHCKRGHDNMRRFMADNPGAVQLIHRHFPLDNECNPAIPQVFHKGACLLARAAFCAGEQRRFWQMDDLLYRSDSLPGAEVSQRAEQAAIQLGLDMQLFNACLNSETARGAVHNDIEAGFKLGLTGTPSFLIDGKLYEGQIPADILTRATAPKPH